MRCEVCGDLLALSNLFNHYRIIHPSLGVEVETWPDGDPVVYDETVDEEFFK
jgi:hypothetical protein